jgi:hypothetical protein
MADEESVLIIPVARNKVIWPRSAPAPYQGPPVRGSQRRFGASAPGVGVPAGEARLGCR